MARPDWVRDLDDYAEWLQRVIGSSGGWLEDDQLNVRWVIADKRPVVLEVLKQHLLFVDEQHRRAWLLDFEITVGDDLTQLEYSYHFQSAIGEFVWRYDKQPGHEDVGLTHAHFPPDDLPRRSKEVDLEDVVAMIRQHIGWDV